MFVLVVEGKTLSRESLAEQRCELSAVSPLALLDAPFASTIRFYQPSAVSAESAVVLLIGTVAWHLPHWMIPAGRLMLENVTPLAAARNIVAADMVWSQPILQPDKTTVKAASKGIAVAKISFEALAIIYALQSPATLNDESDFSILALIKGVAV